MANDLGSRLKTAKASHRFRWYMRALIVLAVAGFGAAAWFAGQYSADSNRATPQVSNADGQGQARPPSASATLDNVSQAVTNLLPRSMSNYGPHERITAASRAEMKPKLTALATGKLDSLDQILSFYDIRPKPPDSAKSMSEMLAYRCAQGDSNNCELRPFYKAAMAISSLKYEFVWFNLYKANAVSSLRLGHVCKDDGGTAFIFDLASVPGTAAGGEPWVARLPGFTLKFPLVEYGGSTRIYTIDDPEFLKRLDPNSKGEMEVFGREEEPFKGRPPGALTITVPLSPLLVKHREFCAIQASVSVQEREPGKEDKKLREEYEAKQKAKRNGIVEANRTWSDMQPNLNKLKLTYLPIFEKLDSLLANYGLCDKGAAKNETLKCGYRRWHFDPGNLQRIDSIDQLAFAVNDQNTAIGFSIDPQVWIVKGEKNYIEARVQLAPASASSTAKPAVSGLLQDFLYSLADVLGMPRDEMQQCIDNPSAFRGKLPSFTCELEPGDQKKPAQKIVLKIRKGEFLAE